MNFALKGHQKYSIFIIFRAHVPKACVMSKAAESESTPELESIGVDRLVGVGAGVSKVWPTLTQVRSRSQQTMILAERLSMLTKTLKDRKKRRL